MEDEDLLFFKRFPKEKQDQVRGLVEYATLMGLSGKDLVSIGGKLDRIKQAQEKIRNMEIVNGFECLPIGIDRGASKSSKNDRLDERFKIKTANGAYNFQNHFGRWDIKSLATKTVIRYQASNTYDYDFGRIPYPRRQRYILLMDIATNKLLLNF